MDKQVDTSGLKRKPIRALPAALLALSSALLLFACAVTWHIDLLGLYMDAVNPDYMVVDVLNGVSSASQMWYLPGNLLAGRFPLLTSLYHGTQNIWLAIPFVAMFGPSVASLRAAQALAGAAILATMFFFLRPRRIGESQWLAWLPVAVLALDPVFVYAFRTQLYIQLGAVAWLFAALLAGEQAFSTTTIQPGEQRSVRPTWLVLAGICYGLSVFGYFIFIFFAPALAIALAVACRNRGATSGESSVSRAIVWLGIGLLIGVAGYIVGYYRIMREEHGVLGFLQFAANYQQSLGAFEKHLSPLETIGYFATLIWRVFSNDWQHALMFNDAWAEPGSALKLTLLIALPVLVWIWCEIQMARSWRLRLTIGLIVCFPAVAMLFGDRLSGHHFVVLLPLTYMALGLALVEMEVVRLPSLPSHLVATAIWLVLACMNLVGLRATDAELVQTHGRGLFSDAINHFALDTAAKESQTNKQLVYLPDWGLFMPFHFLTNGKIRHWTNPDVEAMRHELCHGQSITVALVTGDIRARFLEMTAQLQWQAPVLLPYLDHEGHEVFTVGRFDASAQDIPRDVTCAQKEKP